MTAPEPRDTESASNAEQSTLTLVRDDDAEGATVDESADDVGRSAAPARRKIWPA
jgi:hypothetical protein